MRRLVAAVLLLYPSRVRRRHGAELECLVNELIERDGASRPAVVGRLAADGLTQRLLSRSTAWVVAGTLSLTSLAGLAVSDFASASAHARTVIHHRAAGRSTPSRPQHRHPRGLGYSVGD